jgi:hypothetical protein
VHHHLRRSARRLGELDIRHPPRTASYSNEPGTITVYGTGFTPGDPIHVTMDTVSGQYTYNVTANEPHTVCLPSTCLHYPGGAFTVTQPDVACGYVPDFGDSYITAQDGDNEAVDPATSVATGCPDLLPIFNW